ncbi:MAG: hypothetical protein GF364_14185, partial [Candidatus Lokiarchaeota archaeon]|nr:hypothetical protein [Candidatus Lokiarchaeota archaeon]
MNLNLKDSKRRLIAILIIIVIAVGTSTGIYFVIRSNNPKIIKPLPNPFLLNNGTLVSNEQEWNERRTEIKELLLGIEYGHMPEHPEALNVSIIESEVLPSGSVLNVYNFSIIPETENPNQLINFTVWIFIPSGGGPFPALVKVSPDGTGSQEIINETITSRGYIFACYNHTELDPDTNGYDVEGPCQLAYPSYDWGSLAVWAWGAMRVADYLLAESWV